jgi:hypothetical protein
MEAGSVPRRDFDHRREHSTGLPAGGLSTYAARTLGPNPGFEDETVSTGAEAVA